MYMYSSRWNTYAQPISTGSALIHALNGLDEGSSWNIEVSLDRLTGETNLHYVSIPGYYLGNIRWDEPLDKVIKKVEGKAECKFVTKKESKIVTIYSSKIEITKTSIRDQGLYVNQLISSPIKFREIDLDASVLPACLKEKLVNAIQRAEKRKAKCFPVYMEITRTRFKQNVFIIDAFTTSKGEVSYKKRNIDSEDSDETILAQAEFLKRPHAKYRDRYGQVLYFTPEFILKNTKIQRITAGLYRIETIGGNMLFTVDNLDIMKNLLEEGGLDTESSDDYYQWRLLGEL